MARDLITQELIDFLKKYPATSDVVLFGSRARGDFSKLSDYDIAITGVFSALEKAEIKYFCENEINTLLKIDIIFLQCDSVSTSLAENIKTEGISLW